MFPRDRSNRNAAAPPERLEDPGYQDPGSRRGSTDDAFDIIVKGFAGGRPEHVRLVASWVRFIAEHNAWGFETSDDIVQATLLAVVQNLRDGRFKGGDFRAYVRRIAKNMCITSYRRLKSRGDHLSMSAVPAPLDEGAGGDRIERRAMLDRILQRLEDGCRELLLRAYVEGLSRKEIGDWLGISEEAARVRLFRCVKNARDLLRGPAVKGD